VGPTRSTGRLIAQIGENLGDPVGSADEDAAATARRRCRARRAYSPIHRRWGSRAVAETIKEAIDEIGNESDVAKSVLALTAFFGRSDVPYSVLSAAGEVLESPLGEATGRASGAPHARRWRGTRATSVICGRLQQSDLYGLDEPPTPAAPVILTSLRETIRLRRTAAPHCLETAVGEKTLS